VFDNDDPITAETEAIRDRIRQRALELSHNRPHNAHELYDWIAAEAEVVSVPPVELIERNGTFEMRFAIAGVNPNDVNVMITPNRIVLKSQFRHEHGADAGTVHMCDFKSTTVFRPVNLPQTIDIKSVRVEFEDGIVHVIAAKEGAAAARPKRPAAARKAPARKSRARQP
jgi:HSP20 family protein